jgi:regulator of protease activity HflC (stomatin/prohibitin superfamily)
MNIKKIAIFIGIGIISLILLITLFSSWTDINPGEEGFIYRPYDDGVDTSHIYKEGTMMIAPWNEMITYNIRQQSRNYESNVMDKNGTDIGIIVSANFHVEQGQSAKLHLKHGPGYAETFIDKKVKGAIKDVIGRYICIL